MISTRKVISKICQKIALMKSDISTTSTTVEQLTERIKQSDWTQADTSADDFIKNKPAYSSQTGVYTDTGISVDVYKFDKIVFVAITATKTTTTAAGTNVFSVTGGTANNLPTPLGGYASGAGFYSTNPISAFLAKTGDDITLTVRNTGQQTLSAGATIHIGLSYICE